MPRRLSAVLGLRVGAILVTAALSTLTGCVTVHGERALIPAVQEAEARKVFDNFAEVNNEANQALDASLNATIETGPLGAIDQARIKALKADHPDGNPGYVPLELTDTRFLIPQQRGWPKWFVADCRSNRGDDSRWLLVFLRATPDQAWRASYLSVLSPDEMPEFARDEDGYAEAVPVSGSDLLVQPAELSREYTDYLQAEKTDRTLFADGQFTSGWREQRAEEARTASSWAQYADQPLEDPRFTPVALRTADGGALVFFSTNHRKKVTASSGLSIKDEQTKALLTGTPKNSVTLTRVSEQAVTVPPKDAEDGKVVFLNRIEGLVAAKGE